jgi:hypothetical protein
MHVVVCCFVFTACVMRGRVTCGAGIPGPPKKLFATKESLGEVGRLQFKAMTIIALRRSVLSQGPVRG